MPKKPDIPNPMPRINPRTWKPNADKIKRALGLDKKADQPNGRGTDNGGM